MEKRIETTETTKGSLSVLAATLLWSSGGLLIKLIPWSPFSINAGRSIIALIFRTIQRRSFRFTLNLPTLVCALCLSATNILFSVATKYTTAGNAILLQYSFPLILIILTWIFRHRRPSRNDIITNLVIVCGIFLCCFDNLSGGGAIGNVCALISGVTFGSYFFMSSNEKVTPVEANCLALIISSLFGIPWLIREQAFTIKTLLCLVALGALQMGLSFVLLEYGLKRITAINASFITTIEPILNPIWVAVFYGEKMGLLAIIGGSIVIIAVLLNNLRTIKSHAQSG